MSEAKEPKGVTINVMGREFRVAAPGGEERQLVASVEFLNKKMREIRDTGKVVGNERIAIMAALNIAHEFLQLQAGTKPARATATSVDAELVRRKMDEFEGIIEKAVADQEKLF
ncbi:MAG: cell division protein ZapA [Burkholderiales bacterium]|nr:cell division protein ZapA [Burkholderiales bacterium]